LAASDAFVMSSDWEGLPTVAIEALFAGTQVVSTENSTGIREILGGGEYGWLSPIGNAEQLAENIIASRLWPKERAKLIAGTRPYEVDAVARNYMSLFEQVLRRTIDKE
jgi:glycosyltransferase involved in cell wall biosynthesis